MGGSGPKILKTGFRHHGWPKRSTHWANFLVESWGPRPFGVTVAATLILPQKLGIVTKNIKIMVSHHQSIDSSLLILFTMNKFQSDWTKNSWVSYFGGKMGIAATVAPKGLGPKDPTKKLAQWMDLLGQMLSRKPVLKIFGPEPPPSLK